jgi:putative transcriptional regulator
LRELPPSIAAGAASVQRITTRALPQGFPRRIVRVMSQPCFLSGQLLLSMPGIGDPRFERVVIAMCVHDADGALGIVTNQPLDGLSVRELMAQIGIAPGETPADAMVMTGGPVEPTRGFVLHSPEYSGQSSIAVGDRWALTSTVDVLRDIAAGKGPRRWLSALGYTGWAPGQLDGEMQRHGWQAAPGESDIIFDTATADRWTAAYDRIGIAVGRLSAEAGRA